MTERSPRSMLWDEQADSAGFVLVDALMSAAMVATIATAVQMFCINLLDGYARELDRTAAHFGASRVLVELRFSEDFDPGSEVVSEDAQFRYRVTTSALEVRGVVMLEIAAESRLDGEVLSTLRVPFVLPQVE